MFVEFSLRMDVLEKQDGVLLGLIVVHQMNLTPVADGAILYVFYVVR